MYTCKPLYPYPLLMNQDKNAIYDIHDEHCNFVKPTIMSLDTPIDRYIFAISVDAPEDILIYPSTKYHETNDKSVIRKKYFICDASAGEKNGLIRPMYNHNIMVKNKDVVSAGEITIGENKIVINNQSGHYCPDYTSLNYVEELLLQIGFTNIEKYCVLNSVPNLNTFKRKIISPELWEKYGIPKI